MHLKPRMFDQPVFGNNKVCLNELFPPKKLVAFQLNKGALGSVGGNLSRLSTVTLPFEEEMCQKIKYCSTYGDI